MIATCRIETHFLLVEEIGRIYVIEIGTIQLKLDDL